jgi:predicted amidohydrolase
MIIAAAQTKPHDGRVEVNIRHHLQMADLAARKGVELLLFPEMSLTGYGREHAQEQNFSVKDARLQPLKEKATEHNMCIVAGAPIKIGSKLHIGAFIIHPGGDVRIYTKQYLHEGEEQFFCPCFDHNPKWELKGEHIAIAICADIDKEQHAADAAAAGATVYLASIFYTPEGLAEGYQHLGSYAQKYGMKVLMANYTGESYGMEAGGGSGYWNSEGTLVASLDNTGQELLIVEL